MVKYGLLLAVVCASAYLTSASMCTLQYDPVCGTNGKTYSNSCFLGLKMKNDPKLAMRYKGICKVNDRKARSILPCSNDIKEVCGTDGVTYKNVCIMKQAYNSINKVMLLHDGPCIHKPIQKLVNETVSLKENHTKVEKVLNKIKSETNNTKTSTERLNTTTTVAGQNSTNATDSKTKEHSPDVELSCPCGHEFEDICGPGGVAHDHPCLQKCVAKFHSTLQLEFEGKCNGSDLVAHVKKTAENNTKTPLNGTEKNDKKKSVSYNVIPLNKVNKTVDYLQREDEDNCTCSKHLHEMCGTDGVTYNNYCTLRCASAKNRSIKLKHKGPCVEAGTNLHNTSVKNNLSVHTNRNKREIQFCDCARDFMLASEDDIQDYSNNGECVSYCALYSYAKHGFVHKHIAKRSIQLTHGERKVTFYF